MKKVLMLAMMVLMLMPGTAGALTKEPTWAEKWFARTDSERCFMVIGYRMGLNLVCSAKDITSKDVKTYCLASKANNDDYARVPEVIDTVYKVKKYENIPLENLIHLTLITITKQIPIDDFPRLLGILSRSEGVSTDEASKELIRQYEETVRSLLQ